MVSRSSWILGSVLASLSLGLPFAAPAVWGQVLSSGDHPRIAEASGYSMLFVDPGAGSDGVGDGSQRRPFGTISHALSVAAPNSVVVLAPGEYSQASGESFPLRLKPGVTVQGSPARPGQIVIRGGNSYLSPTHGLQNVTVLAADAAGLGNVTVINPHSAGLGMWIESGSPVIREVIFAENGRFGMFIAGAGSPVIQGNRFMGNSGAGLAIAGPSTASIVENLFDRNGTGIQVGGGAAPEIARNRILQNREGLMVRSDARPRLQDNVIAQNRHNGIVEFQAVAAEPIAKTEPQVVAFQAAQPASPAPEEQPEAVGGEGPPAVSPLDIAEPDMAEVGAPEPTPIAAAIAAVSPESEAAIAPPPTREEVSTITSRPPSPSQAPVLPQTPVESALTTLPSRGDQPVAAATIDPAPEATAEGSPEAIAALPAIAETAAIEIPTPAAPAIETSPPAMSNPELPSLEMRSIAPEPAASQPLAPATAPEPAAGGDRIVALRQWLAERAAAQSVSLPLAAEEGEAIELTVTPPPVENVARAETPVATVPIQPAPEPAQTAPLNSFDAPLRVPGARIPVGSGGLQSVTVGNQPSGDGPPAPPSRAASLGLNYRVVVEAPNEAQQDALRAVVSDAFRIRMDGRTLMQAGAYPDRETADTLVESLRSQGFEARVMTVQ